MDTYNFDKFKDYKCDHQLSLRFTKDKIDIVDDGIIKKKQHKKSKSTIIRDATKQL